MVKKKKPEPMTYKEENKEITYTVSELAEAADKVFQTSPDVVTAALTIKGVKKAGLSEAKNIVKAYTKKEVK